MGTRKYSTALNVTEKANKMETINYALNLVTIIVIAVLGSRRADSFFIRKK